MAESTIAGTTQANFSSTDLALDPEEFLTSSNPKRHSRPAMAIALAVPILLVGIGTAVPASATEGHSTYYECNPTRRLSISTTSYPSDFGTADYVLHTIAGLDASWITLGYHSSIHAVPGGTYTVYTTDFFSSYGAGCA